MDVALAELDIELASRLLVWKVVATGGYKDVTESVGVSDVETGGG